MRRTIQLYIAREVVSPFVVGLFVLTFVLLMFQLLKLTEMVVAYGVSVADVGRLIAYILPPFFVFTVPMAFLLAVMLAFARMSGDSELVALRASGVSLYQLYPMVGVLSVLAAVAAFLLTVYAEPWGRRSLKEFLFELARTNVTTLLRERVFNDDFSDLVIYAAHIDGREGRMEGVFVADERRPEEASVILAREGRVVPNPHDLTMILRLRDGSIHPRAQRADSYQVSEFRHLDINLEMGGKILRDTKKTYLEMGLAELARHVRDLKERGESYEYHRAHVEYHKKFAFAFAAIVFGVLGMPLAIAPVRSGRSRGFAVALGVLVFYYLLFRTGETIGWKGVVHPAVVMWAPNALLGAVGVVLFVRKARETDVQMASWFDAAADGLRRLFGAGGR